jgi:signal transduction histidine kinase
MENQDLRPYLGHLTSVVGHQVINSFSTIVSQCEILHTLSSPGEPLTPDSSDRIQTVVRTALDASVTMRRLIEISHDWTSIDISSDGSPAEEIRLEALVADFLTAEKQKLGPAVDWSWEPAATPALRGRSSQLRTMLRLLAENAVESLPEGLGSITLASLALPRNWVSIEIRDTGCGMTPEVLERATEPFFTTKPDRLGIGLTIARGIWRRHRGTLTIESQAGTGTTIRLSAPSVEGS